MDSLPPRLVDVLAEHRGTGWLLSVRELGIALEVADLAGAEEVARDAVARWLAEPPDRVRVRLVPFTGPPIA
jgi:hypothetical protein